MLDLNTTPKKQEYYQIHQLTGALPGLFRQKIKEASFLTSPEKERLVLLVQESAGSDGRAALDKLTSSHLLLVIGTALQYHRNQYRCDLSDLVQVGAIGLINAIDTYESGSNTFFSYAKKLIKSKICNYLSDHTRTISLPGGMIDKVRVIRKAISELTYEYGRGPTKIELAEEIGLPLERIDKLTEYGSVVGEWSGLSENSITKNASNPFGTCTDYQLKYSKDLISDQTPDAILQRLNDITIIRELLSRNILTARESEIIDARFIAGKPGSGEFTPYSLEELGMKFDCTRESIRIYQNRALQKLKLLLKEINLDNAEIEKDNLPAFRQQLMFLGQGILPANLSDTHQHSQNQIAQAIKLAIAEQGIDKIQLCQKLNIMKRDFNKMIKGTYIFQDSAILTKLELALNVRLCHL